MALGTTRGLKARAHNKGRVVYPVAVTGDWITVIDAATSVAGQGGVTSADASIITNTSTDVAKPTTHRFTLPQDKGTYVALRLKHRTSDSALTSPVVKLIGRAGDTGKWVFLPSKDGTDGITLTATTASDIADGTHSYSDIDVDKHVFDRGGCDQFLVGVTTAYASTGSTSEATVEAKVWG